MQLPLFRLRLFALMWIHFAAAEDRMRVPLFPPAPFPMLAASYRGLFQRVRQLAQLRSCGLSPADAVRELD